MANNSNQPPVMVPFNLTFSNIPFTCDYIGASVMSRGLFRKSNPLKYPLPLLMLQLGTAIIISTAFQRLLRPFKQPRFVSDMLAGILLGPSVILFFIDGNIYASMFSAKQTTIMDVLELLNLLYLAFLVGVRTDLSMIKTSGRMAWVIGITAFLLPVALAIPIAHKFGEHHGGLAVSFDTISILSATTSFQVTSVLLEDLKLLNSEIGRLALSSSLISNLCGVILKVGSATYTRIKHLNTGLTKVLYLEFSRIGMVLVIVFLFRPLMFRLMKRIPEGRTINQSHLIVMTMILFGTSFVSEAIGAQAYFGAMVLGFAVPAGPPLGSGLADKLNLFVNALLMPSYIVDACRHVNVGLIKLKSIGPVEVIIVLAYAGKLLASVVPSRFFRMPFKDSIALGLVLCSQGFFDVLLFKRALRFTLLSEEFYSILVIMAVIHAAIATPLISYLYDPSKMYINYRRRTIQHLRPDNELRILVCIHEEESIFGLLNLLNATFPNRVSPLGIYILDLLKLQGREHPLLINHQFHNRSSSNPRTGRIISAFRHYELQHEGMVKSQYYTIITPHDSMHGDICTLALQKSTALIIVPFEKSETNPVRGVKRKLLEKAPCSVGILLDKKILTYSQIENKSKYTVCVVFTGGPDSREALAYGARMVEQIDTRLTVLRLVAEDEFVTDLIDSKLDMKAIAELSGICGYNDRVDFREMHVKDGAETSRVLMALDENVDLILVGRRVDSESSLVSGLVEWAKDFEELGILGDMLASSDMKCNASVLVLQQQSTVEDLMPHLKLI